MYIFFEIFSAILSGRLYNQLQLLFTDNTMTSLVAFERKQIHF